MTKEGKLGLNWENNIMAEGKNVVVVGRRDTVTDRIGTSMRQQYKSLMNFEFMPQLPTERTPVNPWLQCRLWTC